MMTETVTPSEVKIETKALALLSETEKVMTDHFGLYPSTVILFVDEELSKKVKQ